MLACSVLRALIPVLILAALHPTTFLSNKYKYTKYFDYGIMIRANIVEMSD